MCGYKNEAKVSNQDCFAFACNDAKRYAAGKVVILRALARRISCKKRSFGFHPQDDIGVLSTRHCEIGFSVGIVLERKNPQVGAGRYSGDNPNNPRRSVEAIHKNEFNCVKAGTPKSKRSVFSWIASLPLAMTSFNTFRGMTNVLKKKAAFTLAEVLITLGIIGIVAAMTLPTLLSNVQDKILESESKKAANIVANGYKLMMARDEIFKVENLPFLSNCEEMEDMDCVSKGHKDSFSITNDSAGGLNSDIMPAQYSIDGKSQPSQFHWSDTKYMFTTGDGMIFGVIPDETFTSFDVIVDVNGKNNPNIAIKDLHKYRFNGEGGQSYDVSEELAQAAECSREDQSGCTTPAQCQSLGVVYTDGEGCREFRWNNGACVKVPSSRCPK